MFNIISDYLQTSLDRRFNFCTITISNRTFFRSFFFLSWILIVFQLQSTLGQMEDNQTSQITVENISSLNNAKIENNVAKIMPNISNFKVNVGPDLNLIEGSLVSLSGEIPNIISTPEESVVYSWKQLEGPKIEINETEKNKQSLTFIAPNRPNDTKYVFELSAIQKKPNQTINLGNDTVGILITDVNKVAKGIDFDSTISPGVVDPFIIGQEIEKDGSEPIGNLQGFDSEEFEKFGIGKFDEEDAEDNKDLEGSNMDDRNGMDDKNGTDGKNGKDDEDDQDAKDREDDD